MKTIITTLFTLTLLFISFRSLTWSAGPPPAHTNAPGDPTTCSECHGNGDPDITSGPIWDGMSLSVVGATLGTLDENTTYTFNLTFSNPASIKYGFQLCVLEADADASSPSLGTLISTTGLTQIVSGGNRDYLEHTTAGNAAPANTQTWTFQWQTPASYAGDATFYVVVNSTDNDSGPSSTDTIYAKTFTATVALPVSWLYTRAEMEKEGIAINWATASEKNNWKFDIEKSVDRKEWNTIGSVKGMSNSSLVNKYSFRDEDIISGVVYYRVKQVDFNGEYSYSHLVSVQNDPETDEPTISYSTDKSGYVVRGKKLKSIQVTNMKGETTYPVSGGETEQIIPSLTTGIYLVQIHTATDTYYQKIVMF